MRPDDMLSMRSGVALIDLAQPPATPDHGEVSAVVVLPKPEGALENRLFAARAKGKVQRQRGNVR